MFLKLLLTALVIAGALLTLRMRSQKQYTASAPVLNAAQDRRPMLKFLAAGVVALMLAGAALYLYHQWSDAYQVVTVRVIDTRSDRATAYQVYKGDIDGRSFVTTDGRTVTLAEVERLEVGAP